MEHDFSDLFGAQGAILVRMQYGTGRHQQLVVQVLFPNHVLQIWWWEAYVGRHELSRVSFVVDWLRDVGVGEWEQWYRSFHHGIAVHVV